MSRKFLRSRSDKILHLVALPPVDSGSESSDDDENLIISQRIFNEDTESGIILDEIKNDAEYNDEDALTVDSSLTDLHDILEDVQNTKMPIFNLGSDNSADKHQTDSLRPNNAQISKKKRTSPRFTRRVKSLKNLASKKKLKRSIIGPTQNYTILLTFQTHRLICQ